MTAILEVIDRFAALTDVQAVALISSFSIAIMGIMMIFLIRNQGGK